MRRIQSSLSFLERFNLKRGGARDADHGEQNGDQRIAEMLGTRPTYDPANDRMHAEIEHTLTDTSARDAKERELSLERQKLGGAYLVPALIALLVASWLLETGAAMITAGCLGVSNALRPLIGVTLASAMIYVTHKTVTCLSPAPGPHRKWRFVVWTIHALLVLAAGVVRLYEGLTSGGDSFLFSIAAAILTMAMIAVPPFFADLAIRMLASRLPTLAKIRELHRELAVHERAIDRARKRRDWYVLAGTAWDNRHHLADAAYDVAYRSRASEIRSLPSPGGK